MAFNEDKCVPANVLEHADSVFTRAIVLSNQIRALVNHLCGPRPEPIDKCAAQNSVSAFGNLRDRADDALNAIQAAQEAMYRLESEVGFYQAEEAEPKVSKARFAC